ncbi:heavy-metal-associated domain-containing protein [Oscillatoria sp. HE19RPO]|uniref:heavy-metal-associated domain-containing protein n=1 Tax=Oscillatoria sp. HE19RPO TaxID=2954806 RepID=UPI0020C1C9A3|nr:heavy-metal-associated domain-containing protein [Oscillatoria sp. HE19RPO]
MALKLKVPSMVCEGCAEKVTGAIKTVDSDAKVDIDLESKTVTLDSAASESSFKQAITAVGFEVKQD